MSVGTVRPVGINAQPCSPRDRALGGLLQSVAMPSPDWFGCVIVWTAVWALCFPALPSDPLVPSVHSINPLLNRCAFLLPALVPQLHAEEGETSPAPDARLSTGKILVGSHSAKSLHREASASAHATTCKHPVYRCPRPPALAPGTSS